MKRSRIIGAVHPTTGMPRQKRPSPPPRSGSRACAPLPRATTLSRPRPTGLTGFLAITRSYALSHSHRNAGPPIVNRAIASVPRPDPATRGEPPCRQTPTVPCCMRARATAQHPAAALPAESPADRADRSMPAIAHAGGKIRLQALRCYRTQPLSLSVCRIAAQRGRAVATAKRDAMASGVMPRCLIQP